MIISMFLSVPHCAFNIFATGKPVTHGGEYRLEIPANFHFYVPEKTIKLAKNKMKIGEGLSKTVTFFSEQNM